MSWVKILASVSLFAVVLATAAAFRALTPGRCSAPSRADKERLAAFIRHKYNLPAGADIGVADGGPVSGSCFRELVFASLEGPAFRAKLFVSPDFRFLTKDILDARPDPKAEADRRRKTAEALAVGNAPARGTDTSPVTLAVFSDFQCPYCARLAKTISDLPSADQDRLRILYRYFPLSMHKWARAAAEAAACTQRQNGVAFWNLHDYLFTHQKEISSDNLKARVLDWARSVPGIDRNDLETCMSRSLTSGQVEQDIALGNELGVGSTPTVFLNGDLVEDTSPDKLPGLIARALSTRQ
jgi:protein-disulfide isomerase